MRFAGTWRQYSKNAIAQLATMTIHSGADLNFKCPYHANVIKTFEATRRRTGKAQRMGYYLRLIAIALYFMRDTEFSV